MPLIGTKAAASSQGFGQFAESGAEPVYIEDVFSTYLYTGTGSTQTITNGIDLSGKGGLVWTKSRSVAKNNGMWDTVRGAGTSSASPNNKTISSNGLNLSAFYSTDYLSSFNSTGFAVTYGDATYSVANQNSTTYASWSFRKQPKFFDIQTWTGSGVAGKTITHDLDSVPGCIMVLCTTANYSWYVYHRSANAGGNTTSLQLNSTAAAADDGNAGIQNLTSTTFQLGGSGAYSTRLNDSGQTYIAYIFAHDAGGFGLEGTDNVISCGSYVGNGSAGGPVVTLGWEPQWLLVKNASGTSDWNLIDNMRGFTEDSTCARLSPNLSNAENTGAFVTPTATGFQIRTADSGYNTSAATYIYIAIRRGQMKVPTSGANVFSPTVYTGTNVDNRLVDTGIVTDMVMARILDQSSTGGFYSSARLIANNSLPTAQTSAQSNDFDSFMTPTAGYGNAFSAMNGFGVGNDVSRQLNQLSTQQLAYAFRRAAGFFDVVCYIGNGGSNTLSHNLGITPQIAIVRGRSAPSPVGWFVNVPLAGTNNVGYLNLTNSFANSGAMSMNSTSFSYTAGFAELNAIPTKYVAYLFATVAGVSKVGSYTGSGTTKQIDCGFTAGARFVLIKRTDSTGDWYVWDSARGIVAGNDPFIRLNLSNAQSSVTDYIDTYSAGFEISSTAPAAINASGGSFIFLAIA